MTYQTPTLFLVGAAQGLVLGSGIDVRFEDNLACPAASRDAQASGCQ